MPSTTLTRRVLALVRALAAVAATVGLGGVAVSLTRSSGARLGALVRGPATVDQVVGSAAGVATGAVVLWAVVGVLLTAGARLPGAVGEALTSAAAAITPRLFRRVVALGLGFAVVGGASPAFAAEAPTAADGPALDRPASAASTAMPVTPVTVQPGDCLWTIASRQLGADAPAAQVAASWPRWYAANRAAIGADPDLIHPGQLLVPPD